MDASRTLRFLTILMVGFPILYPLASALVFELPLKGVGAIAISPLFYLATVLWIASGVGLRSFRHWSWYTFLSAQGLAAYFNALILVNYSESDFKGYTFLIVLAFQFMCVRLVAREVRVPYLFPRIQWWKSESEGIPSLEVEMRVTGLNQSEAQLRGAVLDLSGRGCFVKTQSDFNLGDSVEMMIRAYGQEMALEGKIVWNAWSTVTHPKGIGIRFFDLERAERRRLRGMVKAFTLEKERSHGTPVLPP
jgi:Tfp pilus assembly protein PilZ